MIEQELQFRIRDQLRNSIIPKFKHDINQRIVNQTIFGFNTFVWKKLGEVIALSVWVNCAETIFTDCYQRK